MNADANAAGAEIDAKAAELAPDSTDDQEALKRCIRNALWDILYDAGWDAYDSLNFNIPGELKTTATRAAICMGNQFGVGWAISSSISDWMMESVLEHGADVVARNPSAAAFVNWAAVTAWYSIS